MNTKIWISLVVALVLCNVALMAWVWKKNKEREIVHFLGPPGPPGPPREIALQLKEELQWSEEQWNAFQTLKEEHEKGIHSLMDSMRHAKNDFFNLSHPDKVVDSISNEIGRIQTEIEKVTFYHFKKVKGICTPEQAMKLDKMLPDFLRKMHRGGLGKHPSPPSPGLEHPAPPGAPPMEGPSPPPGHPPRPN